MSEIEIDPTTDNVITLHSGIQFRPLSESIRDKIMERLEELGLLRKLQRKILDETGMECSEAEMKLEIAMTLAAANGVNGNPRLRTWRLAHKSSNMDLAHDIVGLYLNMSKKTGRVGNHFVARCAAHEDEDSVSGS